MRIKQHKEQKNCIAYYKATSSFFSWANCYWQMIQGTGGWGDSCKVPGELGRSQASKKGCTFGSSSFCTNYMASSLPLFVANPYQTHTGRIRKGRRSRKTGTTQDDGAGGRHTGPPSLTSGLYQTIAQSLAISQALFNSRKILWLLWSSSPDAEAFSG